ncbi:type III-B CRISPR module-associated protein Cmr5 [Hydrogenobacter thermophilus]|uniref:type III-B CRISPR module-associated protein Cmr5 n=1 Tax=Hydrogenobacter thermophilus TaxID=940 RepID=UPI0030FA9FCB
MRSRVQEVAKFAYDRVSKVRDQRDQEFKKKYSSHAQKLPSMIVHNGLLTTVAFIRSKANSDKGWEAIEGDIKAFLNKFERKNPENLVEFFANLSLQEYRLYTQKLLYFAQWLKRIVEGELKYEGEE